MSRKHSIVGRGMLLCLVLLVVGISSAGGMLWIQERTRQTELQQAREAMAEGRLGLAYQRLGKLAARGTHDPEVLILLGECEAARGRRDEALSAWEKVPPASPLFARASLLRATHLINMGRYSRAEEVLESALSRPEAAGRYELERALSRLYRFEGRQGDIRRLLRASWGRSSDPAGLLKELWLLDNSPIPAEALRLALEKADQEDDRVWLGRASLAILTGEFAAASRWLERCRERRPEDQAVWQGYLDLTLAGGDPEGFRAAASRLGGSRLTDPEVHSLRAWLAAQRGDREEERKELTALLQARPGDTQAIERLAALAVEGGDAREAERLHRLKSGIDQAKDRFRKTVLDDSILLAKAGELAQLSERLGRDFDAQAWSLVERARAQRSAPGPVRFDGTLAFSDGLLEKARAHSKAFATPGDQQGKGEI